MHYFTIIWGILYRREKVFSMQFQCSWDRRSQFWRKRVYWKKTIILPTFTVALAPLHSNLSDSWGLNQDFLKEFCRSLDLSYSLMYFIANLISLKEWKNLRVLTNLAIISWNWNLSSELLFFLLITSTILIYYHFVLILYCDGCL